MDLCKEYFRETKLVSHQINSYNDFVLRGIQTIVNLEPPLRWEYNEQTSQYDKTLTFDDVYVDKPRITSSTIKTEPMYPSDARERGITYEGTCYANVTLRSASSSSRPITYTRVPICKIPIMLRSCVCNLTTNETYERNECERDPGGHFIVRGQEKVLVGQLRPLYNRAFVYECKREEKWTHYVEMRSVNLVRVSVLVQAKIDASWSMVFSLPYIKFLLPVGVVFRAIGVESMDEMINDCIRPTNDIPSKVVDSLRDQFELCETRAAAIEFIASCPRVTDSTRTPENANVYIETILQNEIFYHVGNMTRESRARHLGYMIKQLIDVAVTRIRPVDDKCNLSNKRFDSTSELLEFLFQGLFKQFTRTVSVQLSTKKNLDPIQCIRTNNFITHSMMTCFVSGTWAVQKSTNTYTRVGVSQQLSVSNYAARLSYKRRFTCAGGTKGRMTRTRNIHASHFSFVCPYETPEGETVGLVNNLSMTVDVTLNIPSHEIIEGIVTMKTFVPERCSYVSVVLLNGVIVGGTNDQEAFVREFDAMRKTRAMDPTISIVRVRTTKEIHIESDGGRLIRPLFVVDEKSRDAKKFVSRPVSWRKGVDDNIIVFRTPSEIERSVLAMTERDLALNKCDYLEICPAASMFGIIAAVIPNNNHNQSPRNAYQSNMMKQAVGYPMTSIHQRNDTVLHVLDYGQKQITRSKIVEMVGFDELVHGANPIVAVSTHCGFNQEDSVILNQSSVQRGLFCSHTYRTLVDEERKRGSLEYETICAPKFEHRRREHDYSYIDSTGVANVDRCRGLWLRQGVVLVGKTHNRSTPSGGVVTVDTSMVVRVGEEGYLDSVLDTTTSDGIRMIKIKMRIPMIPEIGDKFASSTAQKGTVGMMYRQEDMPFCKDGMVPDLIINPHAIPSRMTINMLLEMFTNVYGCVKGTHYDATAFEHPDMENECRKLLADLQRDDSSVGYATTMYNGATGERFPAKIYVGPAFYQRLSHFVSCKMHARPAVGKVDPSTHQPLGGRKKEGGLKMGEMERDCMISYGATATMKEAFFENSDKYVIELCTKCGSFVDKPSYCNTCATGDFVEKKNFPFASKHLMQQLMATGIKLSFK